MSKAQKLTRERNWGIYLVRGMLATSSRYLRKHVDTTRLDLALSAVLLDLISLQWHDGRKK